jgi:Transposase DDE domain
MPAYANGQRFVSKGGRERSDDEFSDPDASWGHRSAVSTRKGGGFYGYKLDMAVCADTGLPVVWNVRTASEHESLHALPLIDRAREQGFAVKVAIADKGYDNAPFHNGCMDRDVCPVTPLIQTPAVKRGDHKPPTCQHGEWTFAGSRLQAQGDQVALPDRRMRTRLNVGQGQPPAPTDPARDGALREALSLTRSRRARVRTPKA